MPNYEKLPKVNLIRLLSKKRISYNFLGIFINHGAILVGKPASHSLLKLWDRHPIAMSLITNQLVI